jgi:hypothetical protein
MTRKYCKNKKSAFKSYLKQLECITIFLHFCKNAKCILKGIDGYVCVLQEWGNHDVLSIEHERKLRVRELFLNYYIYTSHKFNYHNTCCTSYF